MASFSTSAFATNGFSESAFDFAAVVTGGKGDNEKRRKPAKAIFKPTGLVDLPKREPEIVEARVEQAREVAEEIAVEQTVQTESATHPIVSMQPVISIGMSEMDREIAMLLHKKIRTEEDEMLLLMLTAAATV